MASTSAALAVTAFLTGNTLRRSAIGPEARVSTPVTDELRTPVLGYLAEHGPTRVVDVLEAVSQGSPGASLSTIALALEDLIQAGTVGVRDDLVPAPADEGAGALEIRGTTASSGVRGQDIVSVSGDTRDFVGHD